MATERICGSLQCKIFPGEAAPISPLPYPSSASPIATPSRGPALDVAPSPTIGPNTVQQDVYTATVADFTSQRRRVDGEPPATPSAAAVAIDSAPSIRCKYGGVRSADGSAMLMGIQQIVPT